MALATEAPFPQYFDKTGDPLDAGSLFFGVANQNPEISPVTVYWDSLGTQPAAQPIRTLNGYAVRNGSPALVFAAGDYSITVRNRKGEIVYFSPNSADFTNDTALQAAIALVRSDLASDVANLGSDMVVYNPVTQDNTGRVSGALKSIAVIVNAYSTVDATGATNCTSAVQAIVDANKGRRILFGHGTFLMAGLRLNDSTYNGTVLEFAGSAELKLAPDGGASIFGGAWVGILVKDCARVKILNANIDGNRSAMTATREQIFAIGVAGATDLEIANPRIREVQGDGIYVGQSDWTATSTSAENILISNAHVYNAADAGRNAISIVAGKKITVNGLHSINVGAVINGNRMPGGIDLEGDFGYQTIEDIVLDSINVVTSGTYGVAVIGKAETVDAARDWSCRRVSVGNARVRFTTGVSGGGIVVQRAADVALEVDTAHAVGSRGVAASLDYADRLNGRISAEHVTKGVYVGAIGEVRDFDLYVDVKDYSESGMRVSKVARGCFKGRIHGASSAVNTFGVQCHNEGGAVTQTNVNYEIDIPYDGANVRAFRNESANQVSYTNCSIRNCDFTGYASVSVTTDANIPAFNVRGLDLGGVAQFTNADTTPSVGLGTYDFQCNNAGATSITQFDDMTEGRLFRVRLDNNTTVVHNNALIRLRGAVNITPGTANNFVEFKPISGIAFEISRNF